MGKNKLFNAQNTNAALCSSGNRIRTLLGNCNMDAKRSLLLLTFYVKMLQYYFVFKQGDKITKLTICIKMNFFGSFFRTLANTSQIMNSELPDKFNLQRCEYDWGVFIQSVLVNTVNTTQFEYIKSSGWRIVTCWSYLQFTLAQLSIHK